MLVVVTYDIPDDARRNRVAQYLEGFGWRVQYSVFECDLRERHLQRLVQGLTKLIRPGDQVRIYKLSRWEDVAVIGGPPVRKLEDTTII